MKCTVIVATYNGEAFIEDQLSSILMQSNKPDEVIICDDCSNDNTVSIIQSFIKTQHLNKSWHLICNKHNIGYVRNFIKGVKLATNEVIFFADQDDIWDHNKIRIMLECFVTNKDMLACCCKKTMIDEFGNPIKSKLYLFLSYNYSFSNKKESRKISLKESLKYNNSPGLCLAVKKDFYLDLERFINKFNLTHDTPVGMIGAVLNGFYQIDVSLVKHRQHTKNVSNPQYSFFNRIKNIDYIRKGKLFRLKLLTALDKGEYFKYLNDREKCLVQKSINRINNHMAAIDSLSIYEVSKSFLWGNPFISRVNLLIDVIAVIKEKFSR